jgi:hypothetical protein
MPGWLLGSTSWASSNSATGFRSSGDKARSGHTQNTWRLLIASTRGTTDCTCRSSAWRRKSEWAAPPKTGNAVEVLEVMRTQWMAATDFK